MNQAKKLIAPAALAMLAGCGVDDGAKALDAITSDPEYRALASDGAKEALFKDMDDAAAFAEAKNNGSHSSFVAFQETYPDSELVAEADKEIKRFRAYTATKTEIIPSETLTDEWCWANRGRMGRWSSRAGGMSPDGARFGDLIFWTDTGTVQMVGGGFRGADGGIEVFEGTSFIYQAECG